MTRCAVRRAAPSKVSNFGGSERRFAFLMAGATRAAVPARDELLARILGLMRMLPSHRCFVSAGRRTMTRHHFFLSAPPREGGDGVAQNALRVPRSWTGMSSARALSSSAALGSRWFPAPGERRPGASRHRAIAERGEAERQEAPGTEAREARGGSRDAEDDGEPPGGGGGCGVVSPTSPDAARGPRAAAERIEERHRAYGEALETVGDRKREARESDAWDPARGYKPFDDVQDAVAALRDAKTAAHEAHLERAVALLCQAKGEPPASLDRFDWTYERGVDAKNARCLSFLLAALNKANASTGMCEVLWVANECGLVPALDAKIVKAAVAALGDLDDMGLLDEGEPETLAAVGDALDASDEG